MRLDGFVNPARRVRVAARSEGPPSRDSPTEGAENAGRRDGFWESRLDCEADAIT